jgi:DNA-binding CsgD family transcriptional regulator
VLDFETYVDDINRRKTVSTVFNRFTDAVSQLGFTAVSFQTVTGFGEFHTSLVSGNGMDASEVFVDTDHPLFTKALEQKGPFFTNDHTTGHELCIPLRGVGGSFAIIRARNSPSDSAPRSKVLSFSNAIASVFYTRICSICFEDHYQQRLTKKERHILNLVAKGQTKATIADSMGVTSHAVDFHFRNILKKHDTNRIVVAVAESIRCGAI